MNAAHSPLISASRAVPGGVRNPGYHKTKKPAGGAIKKEKHPGMKKVTLLAAALAAGMTSFGAKADVNHPRNPAAVAKIGSKQDSKYSELIARYAKSFGVPVQLANAVVSVESNFRPNVRGRAGEVGLMQIKPATARMMGYSGSVKELYHPENNIKYGMKYLGQAHKLGGGSTCGTILKYNAGHGAKRMNKVSAAYCAKVKRILGN